MTHEQHEFLDEVRKFRMPINGRDYIEDELLTLNQFKNEYPVVGLLNIGQEIKTGRLQVLWAGEGALVARCEAERWQDAYLNITRKHLNTRNSSLKDKNNNSKKKGG